MTIEQVRNDLKELRYYYIYKTKFDNFFKMIGNHIICEKSKFYSNIILSAPLRIVDYYYESVVQGKTQETIAMESNYSVQNTCLICKQMTDYLMNNINQ